MKKQLLKWSVLLTVGFLFACEGYNYLQDAKLKRAAKIAEAKAWYESQVGNRSQTRASAIERSAQAALLSMKPDWELTYSREGDNYRTVESVMRGEGQALFLSPELCEKTRNGQNRQYRQSMTRLVVKTDTQTGETVGFTMTIVPSVAYLESTDFKAYHSTYVKRDEHFDGYVIYHNLDGTFANGWKYENGEITHTVDLSDTPLNPQTVQAGFSSQSQTRGLSCQTHYSKVEYLVCTDYYTIAEWSASYDPFVSSETVCSYEWEIVSSWQECHWTGSSGGSSGGGGGPSNGSGKPGQYNPSPLPPALPPVTAQEIFKNIYLPNTQWDFLNNLIDEINSDCMGEQLVRALQGKEIPIVITPDKTSSFKPSGLTLSQSATSDVLFHELLHSYQSMQESTSSWNNSVINMEIETHYAHQIYTIRNSLGTWREEINMVDRRFLVIKQFNHLIDDKGNLRDKITNSKLDAHMLISSQVFKMHPEYSDSEYNYDRIGIENFKNVIELSKDCK